MTLSLNLRRQRLFRVSPVDPVTQVGYIAYGPVRPQHAVSLHGGTDVSDLGTRGVVRGGGYSAVGYRLTRSSAGSSASGKTRVGASRTPDRYDPPPP
jgi:hypothetical protein